MNSVWWVRAELWSGKKTSDSWFFTPMKIIWVLVRTLQAHYQGKWSWSVSTCRTLYRKSHNTTSTTLFTLNKLQMANQTKKQNRFHLFMGKCQSLCTIHNRRHSYIDFQKLNLQKENPPHPSFCVHGRRLPLLALRGVRGEYFLSWYS